MEKVKNEWAAWVPCGEDKTKIVAVGSSLQSIKEKLSKDIGLDKIQASATGVYNKGVWTSVYRLLDV